MAADNAWAQCSPRRSGWSPRLKMPPEGVAGPHGWRNGASHGLRASLSLDQCHRLKAGVGCGGFQVDSGSPAWLWGVQCGFGVCRANLGFPGWTGVLAWFWGFQCAFGVPACFQGFQLSWVEAGGLSTQEVLRGVFGCLWGGDHPSCPLPLLQFDVQPLLPAHGPTTHARAAPLGHPTPHHCLAHRQAGALPAQRQPWRQLVSGGRAGRGDRGSSWGS